jgi:exopolysaccharide production protein ExoZ
VEKPVRVRYQGIQALRFLAAMMVVLTHSTLYVSERLDPEFAVWATGARGVDIFFVISGFVMVLAAQDRTGDWVSAGAFLVRRSTRILPLYWLATTVNLAVLLVVPSLVLHSSLDWGVVGRSYLLVPDYNDSGRIEPLLGVGWTLYFETFFYATFALALWLRSNPLLLVTVVLTACSIAAMQRAPDWPPAAVYLNPILLDFVLGMAVAVWGRQARAGLLGSLCVMALGVTGLLGAHAWFDLYPTLLTRGLPAALIVLGVVMMEPYVDWDRVRALTFLGAASYALYLFHPLVSPLAPVLLGQGGVKNGWVSVVASACMAIGVAILVHLLIEAPLLSAMTEKLKRFEGRKALEPGGRLGRGGMI